MTPKKQYFENAAKTVIKNLEKRNMEGYYCPDKESAVAKALELMPAGSVIAWGGSMSLTESGLMTALNEADYKLMDRMKAVTVQEKKEFYAKVITDCDYFLMSTNAITLDGELINIDGTGNRVGFMIYGPDHVLMIVGMNKLVSNVEDGIRRVRDMATPPNTVRLKRNTPCASTGRCADCLSPDCICNQVVITRRSAAAGRIKVILVGEELGY